MRYKKVTEAVRRRHVAAWMASKQTQVAYAGQHGIAESTFGRWVQRFGHEPPAAPALAATTTFVDVEVVDAPAPPLRVHIADTGHVIEVPAGFDTATLRRLMQALC